jgi:hypothetical protein
MAPNLEINQPATEQAPLPVVFDRFTEALNLLASETPPPPMAGQESPSQELWAEQQPVAEPPVKAVATEVATRLAELNVEQKEVVLPLVQSLTESVRVIRQLQHEAANPKEIVAAVEEMREHIVELFEAIGLEYDDQKIEYFIQAMLAPAFAMDSRASLTPEELAKMGTHEVKIDSQLAALVSQAEPDDLPFSHRLGRIVLFLIHPAHMLELLAEPA